MKIILILTLTSLVLAQTHMMDKYKQQLIFFCSGLIKNVCTKENLEFGNTIFQNRLNQIKEEAFRKKILSMKAERNRKKKERRKEILIQLFRRHSLDRHL